MSKDSQGSKPAKKAKKAPGPTPARAPAKTTPGALAVASLRKKKW